MAAGATRLPAELACDQSVSIRRTSLRTRNAANAPDAHERAFLERVGQGIAEGRPAAPSYGVHAREGGGRELRALRPIVFPGGLCAKCHGQPDEIPAEVSAELTTRYPDDRAIGFRPGDLRGAISVRVPLSTP